MMQKDLLDRIEKDLRELLEMVRTRLAEQPEEALKLRPDGSGWNALECFTHLNVFLEMYLPRIERVIHLGKARRWYPGDTVRYTMVGRRIIKKADINNQKPFKTPKRYDFAHKPTGKEAVKSFLINSERMMRNLQAAREVDLNRAKIGWGPSGFFKITLGNALEWLALHGQRHVMQAIRAAHV